MTRRRFDEADAVTALRCGRGAHTRGARVFVIGRKEVEKARKGQIQACPGCRITRDGDSLLIEATDYHAMPLRLSEDDIAELGLRFAKKRKPRKAARP